MYYNLEKTAEVLGLTTGDVNRLREQNKLRAFRDGSNWKFRKEDVEQYLTNRIKERSQDSSPKDFELLNESDEELPTMLADSSSFDSLIDANADSFAINSSENALNVDGSNLIDEKGFELSDDSDDNVPDSNSKPLNLRKSSDADDDNNVLDSTSSSDDLSLASDSGIALLDDSASLLGNSSDIALDANDDIVLGGSSGSNLNLASDSGISLLKDTNDSGFSLEPSLEEEGDIFELAPETAQASSVLALDDNVDTDTATVLGTEEDFMLTPTTETTTAQESGSESASQVIDLEDDSNLFTTSDDDEPATYGMMQESAPVSSASDFQENLSDPFPSSTPNDPFQDLSNATDSPFGAIELEANDPFGGASNLNPEPTNNFDPNVGSVGVGNVVENAVDTSSISAGNCAYAAGKGCAQEPSYSGMAICLGLVPCLILLLLSGIGAYELVRTIWSWDQPFGLTGTLLETIGGLFKII